MKIGSISRLMGAYRFRSLLEDIILPFFIGFFCVSIFFWVQAAFLNYNDVDNSVAHRIPLYFQSKNGQLYLARHGIQNKEADVSRNKANRLQFSIQAKASNQFKTEYVMHENLEKDIPEPPGTVWPWPRIEKEAPSLPIVWMVTPTYRHPYQYAELTRVAQAIYPARRFVRWLLVEDTRLDSKNFTRHVGKLVTFLNQFKVNYTLLKSDPRPSGQKVIYKPKGVEARRTALKYIRVHKLQGVVYFADDDNTYDSDIFRQMQATKTVSIWPTGAITQWTISSPIVDQKGKVIDFFDAFNGNREFPVDFASFAVHTDLIHNNPSSNIPFIQGYEETIFLKTLKVDKSDFLPLAANATQVLTWHTKTVKFNKNVDIATIERKDFWPPTVRNLLEEYDFLYEKPSQTESRQNLTRKQKKSTLNKKVLSKTKA